MNIIAWLRTPLATLIVLCSALIAQLPHAADVFRLIVMGNGWLAVLHSYTYAVALELAVLLFVVQRRNIESYIFAGVSILVNLSYYYLHGVALLSVAALPAWLISIALPAAIAQYSHLIAAATEPHKRNEVTPIVTSTVTPPALSKTEPAIDVTPAAPAVPAVDKSNKTQLAKILGVTRQTVGRWEEAGVLDAKIAEKLPAPVLPKLNGYTHVAGDN
jgi:hypothetical protein